MPRSCKNYLDSFCHMCSEFTLKTQQNTLTDLFTGAYQLYFGFAIDERNKNLVA